MTPLARVRTVSVPRRCVGTAHEHLRSVGRAGHEGMALWAGTISGEHFHVSHAVVPAQRHIRTKDGVCVAVGPEELHRLNVWLFKHRLTLGAQIHSHPGRAYHSETDDEYAVATAVGCFSLVVPNFAREPFDLARTATYRLDAKGRWSEVPSREVARVIKITD